MVFPEKRSESNQNTIEEIATFNMPSCLTRLADMNVAAKPMIEHNPLNPPIIDGFIPAKTMDATVVNAYNQNI